MRFSYPLAPTAGVIVVGGAFALAVAPGMADIFSYKKVQDCEIAQIDAFNNSQPVQACR